MYQIVIIKKVNGVIRRRYNVGYTTDFEMFHKVKNYFNKYYGNLRDFQNYTVTIYRLRGINNINLENRVDDFFKKD